MPLLPIHRSKASSQRLVEMTRLEFFPILDKEVISANPKIFMGYSDCTNLHLFLWNLGIDFLLWRSDNDPICHGWRNAGIYN